MAELFSQDVQASPGPIAVTTTFETLLVVGRPLTLPSTNGKALIQAWMYFSPGAAVTDVQFIIRAGPTITGRIVGPSPAVEGNFNDQKPAFFLAQAVDLIAGAGDVQYCVSVIQTAATSDGQALTAIIQTTLLSG